MEDFRVGLVVVMCVLKSCTLCYDFGNFQIDPEGGCRIDDFRVSPRWSRFHEIDTLCEMSLATSRSLLGGVQD